MKPRLALTLAVALVALAACGDDDAVTTTAAETTTTAAVTTTLPPETTTIAETTTTVPETTTTTAVLTLPLIDTFDGTTPAIPGFPSPDVMTFDLSQPGFLVIGNPDHSSPGVGTSYYATYPVVFRDGIVRMVFHPGDAADGASYSLFLWASGDLTTYTEVNVNGDTVSVTGWISGGSPTVTTLPAIGGTFDPAGYNELRVEAFDGNLTVFLNDVNFGEVLSPTPLHEGLVGFALVAVVAGSEMTLDEFSALAEID